MVTRAWPRFRGQEWVFGAMVRVCYLSTWVTASYCVHPGRQWVVMLQGLGLSPLQWETWTEFLAPGFSLTQTWLWLAFEEWII